MLQILNKNIDFKFCLESHRCMEFLKRYYGKIFNMHNRLCSIFNRLRKVGDKKFHFLSIFIS